MPTSTTPRQPLEPPPHDLARGTRIKIYYHGRHFPRKFYPATVVSNDVVHGGIGAEELRELVTLRVQYFKRYADDVDWQEKANPDLTVDLN